MPKNPPLQPLTIDRQYIKDLSFENPNAPQIYDAIADQRPQLSISLDVTPFAIADRRYEIVLSIRARATRPDDSIAFLIDLHYAGLAAVGHEVPEAEVEPLLLIEAPRYLFPFARGILATVVRDGGYAPLVVNPIDFETFYKKNKKGTLPRPDGQGAEGQTAGPAAADAG
jgi:preprotein translocase subunit SecB